LSLASPTSGGRSVGVVRVLTKATEFSFYLFSNIIGYFEENVILRDISTNACEIYETVTGIRMHVLLINV
jgi:hypothetical protein